MVRTRLLKAVWGTSGVLLLAACSGSPDSTATAAPPASAAPVGATPTPTGATTDSPTARVTDMTYRSAAPVWWSGFEIELVSAHLDVATHLLELEVRLTNASPVDTNLGATRAEIFVASDDRVTQRDSVSDTIPHGTTLRTTLVFRSVPDDFDLALAQLLLGGEGVHRAVFRLGAPDANETALALRPRTVPGTVVISNPHTGARFEARDVRLVPAACTGSNPVDVTYSPVPDDQLVLELVGTIQSPSRSVGGVAVERAVATPVGGAGSLSQPGLSAVLGADAAPVRGLHLCFPVPDDTHGKVVLTFDTRLVGEDFVTATGSLQLP